MMIREITNENEMRKAFDIYLEAFPAGERLPIEMLRQRFEEQSERIYAFYPEDSEQNPEHNQELMAFATIFFLGKIIDSRPQSFAVLNYFAVSRQGRSKGYGEQFLKHLIDITHNDKQILIFEIDNPYQSELDSQEYRRLLFYRKSSVVEYPDFIYYMPAFGSGERIDMKLLSAGTSEPLSPDELAIIRDNIHRKMYNMDI